MINGKFFTGLTDKMMRKDGGGPNRQQSHLYWPDESTTPSVRESSHRESILAARRRQSDTPSTSQLNNATDDVAPKDLVRKQMKSRIEFYDHVDTTKDPIRRPSIDKGFQDQKRQTLSSKIEFYDYITEPPTNVRNSAKSSERKAENVVQSASPTKVAEKKITFTENQAGKSSSSSKKEHIIAIQNDDISKKSNISKKNISKSVENLTLKDDDDLDLRKLNKQVQKLKIGPNGRTEEKIETLKRSKVKPILKTRRVEVDEEPEEFVYRNGYDYDEMPVRVMKSRIVRPEEDFYYENRVVPAYTNPRIRPDFYDEEPPLIMRRPIPVNPYYYQPREVLYREPEPRKRTVKYMIPDDDEKPHQSVRSPSPPPPPQEVETPKVRSVQRSNTVRESSKCSDVPNEARLRAHQHLKSSISFYNDTTTATNAERKPLSIRDTAVARVGVGLPDI